MDYFLIGVSGGGTWAFPEESKEELLEKLNEPDNELSDLNEKGEMTREKFNELFPMIFDIIRSRGLLVGEDIDLDEVTEESDLYPEPLLKLPPEDLEYEEAVALFKGENLIPG